MRGLPIALLIPVFLTACAGNQVATPSAKDAREQALQIAAKHAQVEPETLTIVEVQEQTFGNTGLGCEQPDMGYLTVETPGHIVLVSVPATEGGEAQTLDVRVADNIGFVCDQPGASTKG